MSTEPISSDAEQRAAHDRVELLRGLIQQHGYLYFVEDSPQISDAAYDELFEELRRLEREYPHLVSEDSPTQSVGVSPTQPPSLTDEQQELLNGAKDPTDEFLGLSPEQQDEVWATLSAQAGQFHDQMSAISRNFALRVEQNRAFLAALSGLAERWQTQIRAVSEALAGPVSQFQKFSRDLNAALVEHRHSMLSLANAFDEGTVPGLARTLGRSP